MEGYFTIGDPTCVAQIDGVKYKTLADAVAAVAADGTVTTITMIDNEMIDIVGSAITIANGKNIILDLNGYQVVGTASQSASSALITNRGTLTIKDSSDTNADGNGSGKLISGATPTWVYDGSGDFAGSYASNTITNCGTLTIESGFIENISTGSAVYAVDNNSSGASAILNVNGGVVKANSVAVRQFANSTTFENIVNVSGGKVVARNSGIWIQLPGSNASQAVKAALNVTGGILEGSYAFYDYSYGNAFTATQYNLDGGTYNGMVFSYGANINITDGTYNDDVAIKQSSPSVVAVSGGKFAGDVYTYGNNASSGFISGGIFATKTYEYEGNTYDCDWLNLLADGLVIDYNTDEETKNDYPYTVRQNDGEFDLVDGEPYLYLNGKDNVSKITYTRSFPQRYQNHYQCWFVPFDYTITQEDLADFEFFKLHMISASANVGESSVADNTYIWLHIEPLEVGTKLSANRPYIIKPNKVIENHVFETTNSKLYAKDDSRRLRLGNAEYYFDFYGVYTSFNDPKEDAHTWISLNQNGNMFWNKENTGTMGSYRWYFKVSSNGDNDDYSNLTFFIVNDESGATVISESANGSSKEVESIYTANGLKVDKPQKGMNIIKFTDGSTKKIIIK